MSTVLLKQDGMGQKWLESARAPLPPWLKSLGATILIAIAYYLGAQLAFAIGTLSDRIFAPFWPPNVILFCALLLSHRDGWKLILCLTFLAHVLAELSVDMPFGQMVVAFATNSALAILNAI